ncbi:hypothetical protein ACFL6T_03695 [Candidatus Zixiibacteriota bacterium]
MLISANPAERRALQAVYEERFGIPARAMEEWFVYSTGSVLWGLRDAPHLDEALNAFRFERTGIPLLRRAGRFWKPTTVALQVVGEFVARNVIELSGEELDTLLIDGELRGTRTDVEQGYIALTGPDGMVGCGLYLDPDEEKNEGLLISQLSKARWSGLISLTAQTLRGR